MPPINRTLSPETEACETALSQYKDAQEQCAAEIEAAKADRNQRNVSIQETLTRLDAEIERLQTQKREWQDRLQQSEADFDATRKHLNKSLAAKGREIFKATELGPEPADTRPVNNDQSLADPMSSNSPPTPTNTRIRLGVQSFTSAPQNDRHPQPRRPAEATSQSNPDPSSAPRAPTDAIRMSLRPAQSQLQEPTAPPSTVSGAAKRPQADQANNTPPTKKLKSVPTVQYNTIYHGGRADHKFTIFEYPEASNRWYVFLGCYTCKRLFNRDPIRSATRHLRDRHGVRDGDAAETISQLGTRVAGCNAKLAAQNNKFLSVAPAEPGRETSNHPSDNADAGEEVDAAVTTKFTPSVGKLCLVLNTRMQKWRAAIILPTEGSLKAVGMSGTFEDTKLHKNIPACYKQRGNRIVGWAEPSGRRPPKYPVMLLSDHMNVPLRGYIRVPKHGEFEWVHETRLQNLDLDEPNIGSECLGIDGARAYHKQMQQGAAASPSRSLDETDGSEENTDALTSDDETGYQGTQGSWRLGWASGPHKSLPARGLFRDSTSVASGREEECEDGGDNGLSHSGENITIKQEQSD